jgi:hypothetical protein
MLTSTFGCRRLGAPFTSSSLRFSVPRRCLLFRISSRTGSSLRHSLQRWCGVFPCLTKLCWLALVGVPVSGILPKANYWWSVGCSVECCASSFVCTSLRTRHGQSFGLEPSARAVLFWQRLRGSIGLGTLLAHPFSGGVTFGVMSFAVRTAFRYRWTTWSSPL